MKDHTSFGSTWLSLTLLCAVALGCAPQHAVAPDVAIAQLLSEQQNAWNAGDVEGFMTGYERSDALVFTSGGHVRRGFDETLAKYKRSYADKGAMGSLEFELLETRVVGPNAAIVLGRWALSDTPKASAGIFSLVVLYTNEGWRIVHDHTSLTPPAPKDE